MGKALLVPGGPRLVGRAVGVSHRVLCCCIVLAELVLDGPAWEGEAPAEPK